MLVNDISRNNLHGINSHQASFSPELTINTSLLHRLALFLLLATLLTILPTQVKANEQSSPQRLPQYQALSKQGQFRLQLQPKSAIQLNTIHSWQARIIAEQSDSAFAQRLSRLSSADIQISASMAGHGHGLSTQPTVIQLLNQSPIQLNFLVSGIKFQMWGQWIIRVSLPAEKDFAEINFSLTP